MTDQVTFNVDRLYRLLGIKGAKRPTFRSDEIIPVAQVARFDNVSQEILEPRAIFGFDFAAVAGQRAKLEILSRAPGGIIIEQLAIRSASAAFQVGLGRNGTQQLAGSTLVAILEIGSTEEPLRSTVRQETSVAVGSTQVLLPITTSQEILFSPDIRIWVPPGQFFLVQPNANNVAMEVTGAFRELQPAGPA